MAEPQLVERRRSPIAFKLLAFFALPTMLLFIGFAVIAHEVARRNLEAELGTRLEAIAASAATQIRGKYLEPLGPGDDGDDFVLGAKRKLSELKAATGVARLYIFDRDFGSKVDTDDEVVIGQRYFQAETDRVPLEAVFERGEPVSSVLFEGGGGKQYKAGYAPVFANPGKDNRILLAIGVDAPAAFFRSLAALRRSLLIAGALLLLLVLGAAVVVAARMSRPLTELADAAERIGRGDLQQPITLARNPRDEIGLLAVTMEEMRGELAARDERTQRMLSGIAHEVRNPLGGIELFAGILRDEIDEGDERRAHVGRIEREVSYLKKVVESFLRYARRDPPELLKVDLDEVIKEVCELEAADAQTAVVVLESKTSALHCLADRGQLRRVLLNLVRNAVQAATGSVDARVVVTASATEDETSSVWVSVHNTGLAIEDATKERLFEPFFTTREKGTGLGLAFVSEIVTDHGGVIEVSSSEAKGTEFRFSLRAS